MFMLFTKINRFEKSFIWPLGLIFIPPTDNVWDTYFSKSNYNICERVMDCEQLYHICNNWMVTQNETNEHREFDHT